MLRISRTLRAALLALVGLCAASAGSAAERAQAAAIPAPPNLAYVQLASMMAPVVSRANGKQLGSAAVTAVIETRTIDNVSTICAKAPRLLDALVQAFYEQPIDINADRRFDFGNLEDDVRSRLNAALGSDLVDRVHLVSASRAPDEGVLAKLPFSSVLGCRGGEGEKKANGKSGEAAGPH